MKNLNRIGKIMLCSWFLVLLFGTLLTGIFNPNEGDISGSMGRISQTKGPFPYQAIERYFKECQINFARHFAFRSLLIRLNNWLTVKFLNISPVKSVILGKEDWLFQAKENLSPEDPGYFSSIQPFTFDEMEKWRVSLEQRQKWLEKRGILYLFIPVPDKSSIYSEFLPNRMKSFYSQSRLNQLVRHLKLNSDVNFVDLIGTLVNHKSDSLLFHRTDSHWNDFGIFLSYREIVNFLADHFLRSKINPVKISDFRIKKTGRGIGNLARMLFFEDLRFRERRIKFRREFPKQWKMIGIPETIDLSRDLRPLVTENQKDDLPKAVMFHDSSGIGLRPFLSEHFRRILYVRDWDFHFRTRVIDNEKPDIVIDEISEHFLYNRLLRNPRQLIDEYSIIESNPN